MLECLNRSFRQIRQRVQWSGSESVAIRLSNATVVSLSDFRETESLGLRPSASQTARAPQRTSAARWRDVEECEVKEAAANCRSLCWRRGVFWMRLRRRFSDDEGRSNSFGAVFAGNFFRVVFDVAAMRGSEGWMLLGCVRIFRWSCTLGA